MESFGYSINTSCTGAESVGRCLFCVMELMLGNVELI